MKIQAIEAAAQAAHAIQFPHMPWDHLGTRKSVWIDYAKKILDAAQPHLEEQAPSFPDSVPEYLIKYGTLVQRVDRCTCGGSAVTPDHEFHCGFEMVMGLSDLEGWPLSPAYVEHRIFTAVMDATQAKEYAVRTLIIDKIRDTRDSVKTDDEEVDKYVKQGLDLAIRAATVAAGQQPPFLFPPKDVS